MALIAAWNFNEADGDAADISGNGHTATSSGVDRVASQGGYGNAGSFNGTTDYMYIAAHSAIGNLGTGPTTLSAWVYNSGDMASDFSAIWDASEVNSGDEGILFAVNIGAHVQFSLKGVVDYVSTTAIITADGWYHIAAVLDASWDVTFFLNGLQKDTVAGSSTGFAATARCFVGASSDNDDVPQRKFWIGRIDDLRIYNHAQTSGEINADMNTPLASLPNAATLMGAILL